MQLPGQAAKRAAEFERKLSELTRQTDRSRIAIRGFPKPIKVGAFPRFQVRQSVAVCDRTSAWWRDGKLGKPGLFLAQAVGRNQEASLGLRVRLRREFRRARRFLLLVARSSFKIQDAWNNLDVGGVMIKEIPPWLAQA